MIDFFGILLILGGILLLIGFIGQVKIKKDKIGMTNIYARSFTSILGIILIGVSIYFKVFSPTLPLPSSYESNALISSEVQKPKVTKSTPLPPEGIAIFFKRQPWENYSSWFCQDFQCSEDHEIGIIWIEPKNNNENELHVVFPSKQEVFTVNVPGAWKFTAEGTKNILYNVLRFSKKEQFYKPNNKGRYFFIKRTSIEKYL